MVAALQLARMLRATFEQKRFKMADEATNGQAAAAEEQPTQVGLSIAAQYVKDLSFESPNAPGILRKVEGGPNINIGVNVTANQIGETDVEVALKLEAKADKDNETYFNVELDYAGVFRITGVPQESMHPLIMIECPRLLFPFARQIIADCTRNGGFPPLMIDPIDFAQLYRQRMAEAQKAEAEKPATTN